MSSGFLDLAYLIEISIVFNLAYKEVRPLFDRRKTENKIEQITNKQEVKNTIEYCEKNTDKLAEGVASESYKKFISSENSLSKELYGSYLSKWININISIVLFILLFATAFQHITKIAFFIDNFEIVWWILFCILFCSLILPIILTWCSQTKLKSMHKTLEDDLKQFLTTYKKYLAEKAEKQPWSIL